MIESTERQVDLLFVSVDPFALAVLADLLTQVRRFLKPFSSMCPGWEVVTECLLEASGLELPLDNPDTDTDIDMDIEVEAEVDIEAKLPALSQSRDFFPLHFPVIQFTH